MFSDERKSGTYNTREHQLMIGKAAEESVIILKNEKNRLPLNEKLRKLAVIGQNANQIHSNGGGSAEIKALYEISPLLGISMLLGGNVDVQYAPGYYIEPKEELQDTNWQESSLEDIVNRDAGDITDRTSEYEKKIIAMRKQYLEEAVKLASEVDEVIIIGG